MGANSSEHKSKMQGNRHLRPAMGRPGRGHKDELDGPVHFSARVGLKKDTPLRNLLDAILDDRRAVLKDGTTHIMTIADAEASGYDIKPCSLAQLINACHDAERNPDDPALENISQSGLRKLLDGRIHPANLQSYRELLSSMLTILDASKSQRKQIFTEFDKAADAYAEELKNKTEERKETARILRSRKNGNGEPSRGN